MKAAMLADKKRRENQQRMGKTDYADKSCFWGGL